MHRRDVREHRARRAPGTCLVAALAVLVPGGAAFAQVLLTMSADFFPFRHDSPSYVAQHVDLIESRPFDGVIINSYLGRNLLNTRLDRDSPQLLDPAGVITDEAARTDVAPLKGAFKRFTHNFIKVNLQQVGPPPVLTDEQGWARMNQRATRYARALGDARLKGIFFDDEPYNGARAPGSNRELAYWAYADQLVLASLPPERLPLAAAVALSRRRGRELMQAFAAGYPQITVIAANGPAPGCSAWRAATRRDGNDTFLGGAFAAGMLEGTPAGATFVDGAEDYDLHSAADVAQAYAFRKGTSSGLSITNLAPRYRCPFMDAALAAGWSARVSVGFSTFDMTRSWPVRGPWTRVTDVAAFQADLTRALTATDEYVWHYTHWQDWWGDTTDAALGPWIAAIQAARAEAASNRAARQR